MNNHPLDTIVQAQKDGVHLGIPSICSAHPVVLETAFLNAQQHNTLLLIESTCNQVNQYGGYTGMRPGDFMATLQKMAARFQFPRERLILGGDHLGPEVWQAEPAASAMAKACAMVREYVLAGYTKIHVDASMKLGDDPLGPLSVDVAAQRAAKLTQAAEIAFAQTKGKTAPRYVIGTEVPVPGGIVGEDADLNVTAVSDLAETLGKTKAAFSSLGLESAWGRVMAVVVQPGVEFGDATIHDYDPQATEDLSAFIKNTHLVFEAHSTDYQSQTALQQLVAGHFAILKVGPALTFAFREAVFALAMIENELFPENERSNLVDELDAAMLVNPKNWKNHYLGDAGTIKLARKFSLSDRSRYYWAVGDVNLAYQKLIKNLGSKRIPLALISQYLPQQYLSVRNKSLPNQANALVQHKISTVLDDYQRVCFLR